MEYYYPILTLIIALIFFHIILIKYSPKGKRFWKKIDYWWVSIGVVGVIGASFSLRKEYSTAIKPWHKQSLVAVYTQYINSLEGQNKYFLGSPGFDYKAFEDTVQASKYRQAGFFFDSLAKLSLKFKDTILIDEDYSFVDSLAIPFRNFLDTINDKQIVSTSSMATFMLERVEQEKSLLIQIRKQSSRDSLNWILLFFSPYLLAVAIAIRLTKVTAELNEIT